MADVKYAIRQLAKVRGFAIIAVLTLALGIGACAAVFSIVNTTILHPFGYPREDELVVVHETFLPRTSRANVSPEAFWEFQKHPDLFADLAASYSRPHNVVGASEPVRAYTQHASANLFAMLGVHPVLGRSFRTEDTAPNAPLVVVLSHRLWQSHFNGSPKALGQTLVIDDEPATVVGVMPANFQNESVGPLMYEPLVLSPEVRGKYGARFLQVIGRLQPGVTAAQAAVELKGVAAQLAQHFPDTNKGWGAAVIPLIDETVAFARPMLYLLLGAVGFLLLIACANIANLLLARATARRKEIAIRTALGSSRWRIVRQQLAESLLLSLMGGLLGLLLAHASMRLIVAVAPVNLPRVSEISVDGYAVAFSFGLVLLTGLGFGLVPAWQATRVDLNQVLKDGSRGAGGGSHGLRLRRLLVVAEVALALVLLVGAGLLSKSFISMLNVDRGYEPRGLYGAPIALTQSKYRDGLAQLTWAQRVVERVSVLPGVRGAAFSRGSLTVSNDSPLVVEGQAPMLPGNQPRVIFTSIGKEYVATIGMPLLRGRSFDSQETPTSPPVVMINAEFARQYFPDRDPIRHRIQLSDIGDKGPTLWREIVGVVGNVRATDAYDPVLPQVYLPLVQNPWTWLALAVRMEQGRRIDLKAVCDAVHQVDKDVPLSMMWETTQSANAGAAAVRRLAMVLSAAFSIVALLLAALGIYGVMTYHVAMRTGEIGIRMALGAQRGDVLRLILASGGALVGFGLLIGFGGALATTRVLESQLYHLSPYDPSVFTAVPVVLLAVGFFACFLPAWRATRVDPVVALRAE